jgi:hypothetical protein
MTANPIEREPVMTTAVAAILTFLATRYGLEVTPEQAAGAAGLVLSFLAPFARQLVRPTVTSVEQAAAEHLTRPPTHDARICRSRSFL